MLLPKVEAFAVDGITLPVLTVVKVAVLAVVLPIGVFCRPPLTVVWPPILTAPITPRVELIVADVFTTNPLTVALPPVTKVVCMVANELDASDCPVTAPAAVNVVAADIFALLRMLANIPVPCALMSLAAYTCSPTYTLPPVLIPPLTCNAPVALANDGVLFATNN